MLDTGDGFFLLKSRSVSRLDEILFMLNTHNVYSLGKPFGLMTTRISEYLQEPTRMKVEGFNSEHSHEA